MRSFVLTPRKDRDIVPIIMDVTSTLIALVVIIPLCLNKEVLSSTTCEVNIGIPSDNETFVPQNSTVHLKCAASGSPLWEIKLVETSDNYLRFTPSASAKLLNDYGFYQIKSDNDPGVTQLNIVSVSLMNDRTRIKCFDGGIPVTPTIFETTIIVFDPAPEPVIDLQGSQDISNQMINFSWEFLPSIDARKLYYLTVETSSGILQTIDIDKPFHIFTAPEGAQPCEVYNFSVTATYVGATYIGKGCSVPSPVLSRMLPSLPDVDTLESSLSHMIFKHNDITDKQPTINLMVHFLQLDYCEEYPILSYTLNISTLLDEQYNIMTVNASESDTGPGTNVTKIIQDLPEDTVLAFRVVATNTFASVETNPTTVYTTDVQAVTVLISGEYNAKYIILHCDYIANTDAKGCLVELRDGSETVSVNMSINSNDECFTIAPLNAATLDEALGFDIEFDGSIGGVAIPGEVVQNTSAVSKCDSQQTISQPPSSSSIALVIPVATVVSTVILCLIVSITVVIFYLRIKMKRLSTDATLSYSNRTTLEMESFNVYDVPDSDRQSKVDSDSKMPEENIYQTIDQENIRAHHTSAVKEDENFYHVLETSTTRDQSHDHTDNEVSTEMHNYHVLERSLEQCHLTNMENHVYHVLEKSGAHRNPSTENLYHMLENDRECHSESTMAPTENVYHVLENDDREPQSEATMAPTENVYHVLENDRERHSEVTMAPTENVYHVLEDSGQNAKSSSTQLHPSPMDPSPIYQDIPALQAGNIPR